jgi:hypothetical protein
MIEPILLTSARVLTFNAHTPLTNASGFFFERDGRLFLATSRHVLMSYASKAVCSDAASNGCKTPFASTADERAISD